MPLLDKYKRVKMENNNLVLGVDVGTNSLGWALMKVFNNEVVGIEDMGVKIFQRSVQDKSPIPKNVKRRESRLGRRRLQRLAKRKKKMRNYLILIGLLPASLKNNNNPEIALNEMGCPYLLRTKALDEQLTKYELGRVLLHFANYRGFQSNKKTLAGDLADDKDAIYYLDLNDGAGSKEEKGYLGEISELKEKIVGSGFRTLGEYLYNLPEGATKRNRVHSGGSQRTDRSMYKYELALIWDKQAKFFNALPENFIDEIKKIIFKQRPVTWDRKTIGKCSLESKKARCHKSRPEYQEFQMLKDINDLKYYEPYSDNDVALNNEQKEMVLDAFEGKLNTHNQLTWGKIKKVLGLKKINHLNLEETTKKGISGNSTYIDFAEILGDKWRTFSDKDKLSFYEDVKSIQKKSALKKRLIGYYGLNVEQAIEIAIMEFKQEYASLSLKAINKLLPYMRKGMSESQARMECGYYDRPQNTNFVDKLEDVPFIPNPIVMKSLNEVKKMVNAIIAEHDKPFPIRVEMARDLEKNTKRFKENEKFQKQNQKLNDEAKEYYKELHGIYPAKGSDAVDRYKLWKQQDERCIYSGKIINQSDLFSANCEVDHIMPFSKTANNSFFNKTLCFHSDNQDKGNRTPIDAWSGTQKWDNVSNTLDSLVRGHAYPKNKAALFRTKEADLPKDFLNSQLSDTRYIAKEAAKYLSTLGCKVETTKGVVVSNLRHQWGFNSILGRSKEKERDDHRHHIIDAVAIASTSPGMYTKAVRSIKSGDKYLTIGMPYGDIKKELSAKIVDVIPSHSPNNKISGSLHEDTGAGFVEKHGGLVYRKSVASIFQDSKGRFEDGEIKKGKWEGKTKYEKNADKIVDETVKEIVLEHISKFKKIDEAFAAGFTLFHKDGKTPIKRVRVLQSKVKTTKNRGFAETLLSTKKPIYDKNGKVFKYMAYGNINHVEVFEKDEKFSGKFVTVDASSRMNGLHINKSKNPDFKFSLVVNDTVSILDKKTDERTFYRVQKLGVKGKNITIRQLNESTLDNKEKSMSLPIYRFNEYQLVKHTISRLGAIIS